VYPGTVCEISFQYGKTRLRDFFAFAPHASCHVCDEPDPLCQLAMCSHIPKYLRTTHAEMGDEILCTRQIVCRFNLQSRSLVGSMNFRRFETVTGIFHDS
jgi:hypothetical protein